MNSKTLYLKLNQISQVYEKNVFLKDVAEVYTDDSTLLSKCRSMKLKTLDTEKEKRYIGHVIEVIEKITQLDKNIQVNSIGETDFIVDYKKKKNYTKWIEVCKTIFVCFVAFFGSAFAIMTFNNDVSTTDVFGSLYELVMGETSSGFTVLEISYSIGLAIGIIGFFNHFSKTKFSKDPTPLEVEMRLYEENINKALIQNDSRKESDVDVS